jgi:hypothetical protein
MRYNPLFVPGPGGRLGRWSDSGAPVSKDSTGVSGWFRAGPMPGLWQERGAFVDTLFLA